MELLGDLWQWLAAVTEHWHGYVSGGVLAFVLEAGDRLRGWKVSKKLYVVILATGFLWSIFAAWEDEHKKASRNAYMEADIEQAYNVGQNHNGDPFPVNAIARMNVTWIRSGTSPASDFRSVGRLYLVTSDKEVRLEIEEFKKYWYDWLKNIAPGHGFPTIGFVKPSHWLTADGPIIMDEDRKKLWHGSELLVLISAARFEDGTGEWEARTCQVLQPLAVDNRGATMPQILDHQLLTWRDCDGYNSPVRIR